MCCQRRKNRYLLSCAVVSWMLSLSSFSMAQSPVVTNSVHVVADRIQELAKSESQSTAIITKEEIAAKQAKSVEDIIFSETGVARNIDAMGRVTVSIRGAEPRHSLLLLNGMPIMGDFAKYSGQGDELQRIGAENVERIEIIKGAASAKYGADAIGGVVNIITQAPTNKSSLQFNLEGRRVKGDGNILPYSNAFIKANTGKIGPLRAMIYGSKRDIMPIYSQEVFTGAMNTNGDIRNSLRYYGSIKNIGLAADYELNKNNTLGIHVDQTNEDMERKIKHSNDAPDPVVTYHRDVKRKVYGLDYKGHNEDTSKDWQIQMNYTKMNEDDVTLSSTAAFSAYEGKNTLAYVDNITHKEWQVKGNVNHQLNDKHLLTYGIGFSHETGEGSRLKSAHNRMTRHIDPWDYDKNLHTDRGIGAPSSKVYDYAMYLDDNGIPQYDQTYELYGYKDSSGQSVAPIYTIQDYEADNDDEDRIAAFAEELRKENPLSLTTDEDGEDIGDDRIVRRYYDAKTLTWHGRKFEEESDLRKNQQTIGKASINKSYLVLQDTWWPRKGTTIAPIARLDHSSLFGTHATFNLGLTQEVGGKANQRFKANIGTSYTEPGMGELYYNWEMYAGMPYDLGVGKLGYYWYGNPNLKPEKSFNIDLGFEAERGHTQTRMNVFHNRIKDYMTTYFTGKLMNFYPDAGIHTWFNPPDMIYSFKNIGKAEITGVEAEVSHQWNQHWSTKLGYTYLHAINKSDPTMPRTLLNKPQHKVDIGITYTDQQRGLKASLWGDYYIHMLDSNTIANNGNFVHNDIGDGMPVYRFAEAGKQTYERKTFGIWNFLVQKKVDKDAMMYVGVDNVFNHRDDTQAN